MFGKWQQVLFLKLNDERTTYPDGRTDDALLLIPGISYASLPPNFLTGWVRYGGIYRFDPDWNGEVVAEGRSDAVLGNPVTAVAWLARKVDDFGVRLRAGDIVLPGSCTRAIDVHPGEEFVADFAGLGSVRLSFE